MTYSPNHESLVTSLARMADALEDDARKLRSLAEDIHRTDPAALAGSLVGVNVTGAVVRAINNSSWTGAMELAISSAHRLAAEQPAELEPELLEVLVSGKTYYGGLDPLCTDAPKEHGWPEPDVRRQGKGRRMAYAVTREQAVEMAEHLECLAEGFAYSDSPEAKAEGRSFARDAARIREVLA